MRFLQEFFFANQEHKKYDSPAADRGLRIILNDMKEESSYSSTSDMVAIKALAVFLAGLRSSGAFFKPAVWPVEAIAKLCSSSAPFENSSTVGVRFRPARAEEEGEIRRKMFAMMMNPLSIDARNFICAEEEEEGLMIGFGQVKAIAGSNFELSSIYVSETHRRRGIGSNLVLYLVKNFVVTHGPSQLDCLYLLTLGDRVGFYKKLGFEVIAFKDTPAAINAELVVGSFLQFFSGNSCVCMRANRALASSKCGFEA